MAMFAGLTFAVAAHAGMAAKAALVGQHVQGYYHGAPLLICEYTDARARFEILSQDGKCAPYITVE